MPEKRNFSHNPIIALGRDGCGELMKPEPIKIKRRVAKQHHVRMDSMGLEGMIS